MIMRRINIFTAGVRKRGFKGTAYGIVIEQDQELKNISSKIDQLDNYQAELEGVLYILSEYVDKALNTETVIPPIDLYTDSEIVAASLIAGLKLWKTNGYITGHGSDVKHKELYQQIDLKLDALDVRVHHPEDYNSKSNKQKGLKSRAVKIAMEKLQE